MEHILLTCMVLNPALDTKGGWQKEKPPASTWPGPCYRLKQEGVCVCMCVSELGEWKKERKEDTQRCIYRSHSLSWLAAIISSFNRLPVRLNYSAANRLAASWPMTASFTPNTNSALSDFISYLFFHASHWLAAVFSARTFSSSIPTLCHFCRPFLLYSN